MWSIKLKPRIDRTNKVFIDCKLISDVKHSGLSLIGVDSWRVYNTLSSLVPGLVLTVGVYKNDVFSGSLCLDSRRLGDTVHLRLPHV